MQTITFFDTETTNLPNWKVPSGDESQPHLVQLSAIQCNHETEEIINRIDLVIKPEGWVSGPEALETHGITKEFATNHGVPEVEAVKMLLYLCSMNGLRCAHNRTFDQRMIRIQLKRYPEFNDGMIERWAEKDDFICTMLKAKPIMEMPPKGKFGFKNPKLIEAYKFFTGKDLEGAHSSIADTEACMEIYFAMRRREHEATYPGEKPAFGSEA